MASRSQLDLVITALVLARKATSAIEAALNLPATDRAALEVQLDAVRSDLGRVTGQLAGAIPGAANLGRRREVRMAAGVVEFVARQGAAQLGAVAGMADLLRAGGDSRSLAARLEGHLAEVGVATREELAEHLGVEASSERFQEALERALSSGQAEWYGPDTYGVPRGQLEELAAVQEPRAPAAGAEGGGEPAAERAEAAGDEPRDLDAAVRDLEGSLDALGSAIGESKADEAAGAEQIRELRRLADEGVISEADFEAKKREILSRI